MRVRRREMNSIGKRGKPGDVRVAVAYPSLYEVALKTLSFQMLYYYVNSREGFVGERFNLETLRGEEPEPVSVETGTPLSRFELILFSVHYELDYVNIARMLRAAGLEVFSNRRKRPLVIVGGPAVIGNPEPLAEIADLLALGDIELLLPRILDSYLECRGDKESLLESLPPEEGFYAPSREDSEVSVAYAEKLEAEFHPVAQLQPLDPRIKWKRGTTIEVMRGCPRGCRFCLEGSIYGPKRERPLEQVEAIAEGGSRLNSSRRVVLLSLSYFDHSKADRILELLVDRGHEVSVPSLRADTLNAERLELIARGGQRTVAVAPEVASPRLGLAIGKPLLEEKLEEILESALETGIKSVKLYFMVGLPGESLEDVRGIAKLVRRLSGEAKKGGGAVKVTLSPFVPKPQTPMQWFGLEDLASLRKKIAILRKELGGVAELRVHDPRSSRIQAVLARGGREMGRIIALWAEAGGGIGGWRRALRRAGVREEDYLGPIEVGAELPWSKVRIYRRTSLEEEYAKCLELVRS